MIDSKRIAKNTIFLYARLLLIFSISLFSSRVILDKLGVVDYGLQGVVYGVVGMLSFLNATLSSGTSRFITFDLGKGDQEQLKVTFSTALYCHLLLAGVLLVFAETFGLWYVHNVMVCPPERFHAALVIYQVSILQTIIGIIQVPFTSAVMAHERMDIYAYLGIYEAIAKLVVVYAICITPWDRLITWSVLTCVMSGTVLLFYILFTRKKFIEVSFLKRFSKTGFKSILKFSGWNIVATFGNTLMNQGVIMLFNLFFAPVVVAAQNIANQISGAVTMFVGGVRQAVNPQVIKTYAEGNFSDSKRLTLESAEYVFDLLLMFGIPLILIMPKFMSIWLVDVPEYAVVFAQLMILQEILGNFSAAFYTPMVAANKIEKNTYASIILSLTQFLVLYFLFKFGCGPVIARWIGIAFCLIWSFIVKPYILWKDLDYQWRELVVCIGRCMRTFAVAGVPCLLLSFIVSQDTIGGMFILVLSAFVVVAIVSISFIKKDSRDKLFGLLKQKLFNS